MKIPEPKFRLWETYYTMSYNKIAEFKPTKVVISIDSHSTRETIIKILYSGYLNGNVEKDLAEEHIFITKEELLKSL